MVQFKPEAVTGLKKHRFSVPKPAPPDYNFVYSSMPSACEHQKTTIIARRDGVDYVECLDCRQIFEAEDLEPVAAEAEED